MAGGGGGGAYLDLEVQRRDHFKQEYFFSVLEIWYLTSVFFFFNLSFDLIVTSFPNV